MLDFRAWWSRVALTHLKSLPIRSSQLWGVLFLPLKLMVVNLISILIQHLSTCNVLNNSIFVEGSVVKEGGT